MRETGRRIFLAGGGTGGHLYPGLAIAEAIHHLLPEAAIAFSTTRREIDRKVMAGSPYVVTPIDARPFNKKPWTWPGFLFSLIRSGQQARRRFREFCPDVVIGLGGFGSYAPVRVGQKYGAATAILNPDIVPGRANRRLAAKTDRIFCQFQETVDELGPNARLTGCPIRPSLMGHTREEGVKEFGLDAGRKTLLITGASLGARSINVAIVQFLKTRGLPQGWQVLHVTGHKQYEEVAAAYRGLSNVAAVVRPYCEKMGLAYAAGDVAVVRPGASMLAELLAFGLPAILMPYPYHRDQHQMHQARTVEALGAAVVVQDHPEDPAETSRALAQVLEGLAGDSERLASMAGRARAAGRPQAAETIAREILALADAVTERRHAAIATAMPRQA
jgi:UDP-N-acetylglucosamine--N-acetylmuramyl-(pentapeptide) pyrophosphoryl-undecaprenol N-acetylglucosamine transferase